MTKDWLIQKVTSRKFLAFLAGLLTSLGAGLYGYVDGTTSLQGVLVSIGVYALAEGAPDFARALAEGLSNKTVTTKTVTATSTDKATVASALAAETRNGEDPKEV